MMRRILQIAFFFPVALLAQKPYINSITPTHLEYGDTISINGLNLTGTSTVFFGSVKAESIKVVSDNLVQATVPSGAVNSPISVINNNLTTQSSSSFYISFGGSTSPAFGAETLTPTGAQDAYEICLCDLDNDDLNDVVITHNDLDGGREISIFMNNSTPSATDFGTVISIDQAGHTNGFRSVSCGDLDNDGDSDLIFATSDASNVDEVFVYENQGGGTMTLVASLSIPQITGPPVANRDPREIGVADLDNDGKKDLVVGNDSDNTIHIFRNLSSGPGNFSFASASEITITGPTSTGALQVGDLNNDGLSDIVIVPFNESNENIYILRNNSIVGNFSFIKEAEITNSDQRRNVELGDFDQDGLLDIAVTADRTIGSTSGDERVSIFQNTTNLSSAPDITFSFVESITIPSNLPWDLSLGDLNGDGLLDIAVSSVGGDLFTIENNSTSSLDFNNTPVLQAATQNSRNIVVGDLNDDAKPDLAYTHKVNLNDLGDLGVKMNSTCIDPTIEPPSFSFCSGDNFTLEATNAKNATYNWSVLSGGGPIGTNANGNIATFNIVSTTNETIQVEIVQQGCTTTQQIVVTYEPGSLTPTPTIQLSDPNGGVICGGDAITLSTTSTFNEYTWTLPDGSTANTASIDISNASASDAGTYSVVVRNTGNCSSVESFTSIEVDVVPSATIINNGNDTFCNDGANDPVLEIATVSGVTAYQWKRDGSDITGETGTSITADQSGSYSVLLTNANGCSTETFGYTVSEVTQPVSVVNGPTETCVGFETTFDAASTGQSGFTLTYAWQVDGSTVNPSDPTQLLTTFGTAGPHTVTLTTTYDPAEVASCSDVTVFNVTASDPPTISFDQANLTPKCQADSLVVGITSPTASTIASYEWTIRDASDNSLVRSGTSDTLQIKTPVGIDTVWASLKITTTIGCEVKDSIRIRNFPSELDISSTDFNSILAFDSALLEEATSIHLTAQGNATDISWSPAEDFSSPSTKNTIFFPQNPTSIVTLTATDANGCRVSTTVQIILDNIRPKRTFSPNGDGMNDCWEILNIGDLGTNAGCKVYVFDSRGRNIFELDTFQPSDNCVWDGNFNGTPVPEGVYYFVMKCNDDNLSKSGSILLAR